jgi:hypothetical protein
MRGLMSLAVAILVAVVTFAVSRDMFKTTARLAAEQEGNRQARECLISGCNPFAPAVSVDNSETPTNALLCALAGGAFVLVACSKSQSNS